MESSTWDLAVNDSKPGQWACTMSMFFALELFMCRWKIFKKLDLNQWIWGSLYYWFFPSPSSPPHGMDQCNLSTSPLESMIGRKVSQPFIACQAFRMQLKAAVKIKMACICYFLIVQVDNHGKNYLSSIFSSKALLIMSSYFLMVQRSYVNSSHKLETLTGFLEGI